MDLKKNVCVVPLYLHLVFLVYCREMHDVMQRLISLIEYGLNEDSSHIMLFIVPQLLTLYRREFYDVLQRCVNVPVF